MSKSFVLGSTIKTSPNGAISGWLVRFSDGTNHDVQGEYFTKSTDFGNLDNDATIMYQHGLDPVMQDSISIPGKLKMFDEGVWVESQLDLNDKYQHAAKKLIDRGALGWSAGTAGHLVKTTKHDNGATEITKFPLGLDASITPTPAEPTTIPGLLDYAQMKSLQATDIEGLLEDGKPVKNPVAVDNITIKTKEITIMTEKKKEKEALPKKEEGKENGVADMEARLKSMGDNIDKLTSIIEKSGTLKDKGYIAPDSENKEHEGVKSLGDFLIAVKNKNESRLKSVYNVKSMIEATGPDGGYTVPEEFIPKIFEVMKEDSGIVARVTMQPVGAPTGRFPALDQYITPTAGSGNSAFAAGLTGAGRTEGGSYTETDFDFTMVEWKVNDAVSGLVKVSRELSQDAPIVEAMLTRMIALVSREKTERNILRGSGVNEPLGVLNSAALINITPATDNAFAYADALSMLSRFKPLGGQPAWFMHPSVMPDVGVFESSSGGGVFQANFQAGLGMTLLGYPIVFSEHLPQANNSGNVLLADLSTYMLFNLGGMYVDFSEHAFFSTGYNAWRFGQRMDGKMQLKSVITLADPQGSYTVSPIVSHND